jgi:redox-sensitive bicupin YhaK (pirin superfamily)
VARLDAAGQVVLPDAPDVHLFVARGSVGLEDVGRLGEGDAVRLTAAGPRRLVAGGDGAEVLAWEMWTPTPR